MATSNSSNGYTTHVLGSIKAITSSLKIVVYNKYSFDSRISIYNIDEVYSQVYSSKSRMLIERASTLLPFEFLHVNNEVPNGFNTIIYLDNTEEAKPIGFTEFTKTQGQTRDIWIYPEQTSNVKEFEVVLSNSLSSLIDGTTTATKNYIGNDLKDYTNFYLAKNSVKNNITRGFSKDLTEVGYGNSRKGIKLDSGFVRNESGDLEYIKFSLEKNVEYSPYGYVFENFGVSYYGDDIVLYSWTGTNYCATSLTKRNKFGNSIVYTKSGTGYYTIPQKTSWENNRILYTAGKYIICETQIDELGTGVRLRAFNIETKRWETNESGKEINKFVIDELDPANKIIELPDNFTKAQFSRYLPDLTNISLTLEDNVQVKVIRKIGNWFLLELRIGSNTIYAWTGISNTLYLMKKDLANVYIVDDNTIIRRHSNTNYDLKYYFYSGINQIYCTYDARSILKSYSKTSKIKITNPKIIHAYERNKTTENFDKNSLSTELWDTSLNQYRRGSYPIELKGFFPNIVCTIDGILFYINGNYINYL